MRSQSLVLASLAIVACSLSARSVEYDELEYAYDTPAGVQTPFQFPLKNVQFNEPPGAPPEKKTIYQIISESTEYKNLTKALDYADKIKEILNDTSAGITFFAVPDWALRRKPRGHKTDILVESFSDFYDLRAVTSLLESLESENTSRDDKERDDKKKHKRFLKKILHAILSYHILPEGLYVDQLAANITFATNLSLPDGSLDGKPLRIHVEKSHVTGPLKVNFFSTVIKQKDAANGVIHSISHPLLPPPSVFQEAFLVYQAFSVYTSAVQRTGLTDELDLRYVHGKDGDKGSLNGAAVVTSFIPFNKAFDRLPLKLRLFLFSPFGEHVLKKLLQYHIIPDLAIYSDYLYNSTSGEEISTLGDGSAWVDDLDLHAGFEDVPSFNGWDNIESKIESSRRRIKIPSPFPPPDPCVVGGSCGCRGPPPVRPPVFPHHAPTDIPPPIPSPERVYAFNLTVPTLLTNHTLDLHVAKFKIRLPLPGPHPLPPTYIHRFYVNGKRVGITDIPSRNGAAHYITRLINPLTKDKKPPKEHLGGNFIDAEDEENEWDNWEEWLPKWAEEN